jgi:hypothetical protein
VGHSLLLQNALPQCVRLHKNLGADKIGLILSPVLASDEGNSSRTISSGGLQYYPTPSHLAARIWSKLETVTAIEIRTPRGVIKSVVTQKFFESQAKNHSLPLSSHAEAATVRAMEFIRRY